MKKLFFPFLLLFVAASLCAQTAAPRLALSLDRADGRFRVHEPVTVSVRADQAQTWNLTLTVNGNRGESRPVRLSEGTQTLLRESYDVPTAVIVTLSDPENPRERYETGFICGDADFRPGFDAPRDLRKYWKKQIRTMRREKMDVRLTPVPLEGENAAKFECWDVEISCGASGYPVRGYLAKPKGAAPRSLPAVLYTRAAGVAGDWCRSHVSQALQCAGWGGGAIAFDINALGMENGREEDYYKAIEAGEYKDYSVRKITDRESYFFRGMFLRAIRALDFLCSDPSWDGKRVMTMGESQGGAQAAAMAGLDKRVGAAVLIVPAMVDLGGYQAGRRSGWPQPHEIDPENPAVGQVAPYFDVAQLLRGSKAEICVEIGLIDMTCPAAGVFAGVNGVKGPVHVLTCPYRPHHEPSGPLHDQWRETIYPQRMNFIRDYLK